MHLQSILILAGGQSRRMGTDKALLTLPSTQTLLEHHIYGAMPVAEKLALPIFIANNQKDFLSKIEPIQSQCIISHIDDYQAGMGALSAIAGAMLTGAKLIQKNAQSTDNTKPLASAYLLVVSCDALITANEIWTHLEPYLIADHCAAAGEQGDKIYCFADREHSYPLLGLYPYSLQQALLTYLHTGSQRVMSFIKPYQVSIDLPEHWQGLVNVNTPEQFSNACQLLNASILATSKEYDDN